jgi:hypothetical protein
MPLDLTRSSPISPGRVSPVARDPGLAARHGEPDRAGPAVFVGVRKREQGLAHAVALEDPVTRKLLERREVVGRKRRAAGRKEPAAAERVCGARLRCHVLEQLRVHRGHALEDRRALLREGADGPRGLEALQQHGSLAVEQRAVNSEAESVDVEERQRQRLAVPGFEPPETRYGEDVVDHGAKGQQDALAFAGRARRVEQDGRVLVRRPLWPRPAAGLEQRVEAQVARVAGGPRPEEDAADPGTPESVQDPLTLAAGFDEHGRRAGVGEDVCELLAAVARVDRNVRGTPPVVA